MATNLEMQSNLKEKLFMLLRLKVRNKDKNILDLDDMIVSAKAVMNQEDVAWVEKMINEFDGGG